MARYLLIAACCVMVVACVLYTADAAWSCRKRCNRNCDRQFPYRRGGFFGVRRFFYRRGSYSYGRANWLNHRRMVCKQACFEDFANCRICPWAQSCKRCVNGYEVNGDGRCVVAATTPAPTPPAETTAEQSPAETTAGAPAPEPCLKLGVRCPNGLVIDRTKVCDTQDDCGDMTDEFSEGLCGASDFTYSCAGDDHSNTELCNCASECTEGADEAILPCSTCALGEYDCGGDGCLQSICP